MSSSYRNHISTVGVINSILDQDDGRTEQKNSNVIKYYQNVDSKPDVHQKKTVASRVNARRLNFQDLKDEN